MARQKIESTKGLMHPENVLARASLIAGLCRHLREGYSMDSFPGADKGTIKKVLESYPQELDAGSVEIAAREGQLTWERIGRDQATGKSMGNSRAWSFTMGARYGWSDRVQVEAKHSGTVHVAVVQYSPDAGVEQDATQ